MSSRFMVHGKNKNSTNYELRTTNSRGLTLIEILIAMGIAAVAGSLLLVIIVNSAGLYSKQSAKVQGGVNINDAFAEIRESIKQASSIADQYIDGSTTYATGEDQLVLKVSSIDSSGSVIADTYDFFVFFLDQSYLHFKIFPDSVSSRETADQIFSNSVTSLNFQYFNSANPPVEVMPVNATKVKTTLTLQQKSGAGFETSIATSEAYLRND